MVPPWHLSSADALWARAKRERALRSSAGSGGSLRWPRSARVLWLPLQKQVRSQRAHLAPSPMVPFVLPSSRGRSAGRVQTGAVRPRQLSCEGRKRKDPSGHGSWRSHEKRAFLLTGIGASWYSVVSGKRLSLCSDGLVVREKGTAVCLGNVAVTLAASEISFFCVSNLLISLKEMPISLLGPGKKKNLFPN